MCCLQLALEASRCLGELGPADLSSLVLQAENVQYVSTIESLASQMAVALSNLLFDVQYQISQTASLAIYAFVKTKTGFKAAGNLFLYKILLTCFLLQVLFVTSFPNEEWSNKT